MSSHYLLPCECGQSTPIQLSQAGQSVLCACGRSLTVPSMRGIRELKPTTIAPTKVVKERTWNPTRGLLFGAGAIAIIVGLILIAFNYPLYRAFASVRPSPEETELALQSIDAMTPIELWDFWHFAAEHGMGEHENSVFVHARSEAQHLMRLVIAGCVLIGVGAVLVTVPLLMPSSKGKK